MRAIFAVTQPGGMSRSQSPRSQARSTVSPRAGARPGQVARQPVCEMSRQIAWTLRPFASAFECTIRASSGDLSTGARAARRVPDCSHSLIGVRAARSAAPGTRASVTTACHAPVPSNQRTRASSGMAWLASRRSTQASSDVVSTIAVEM